MTSVVLQFGSLLHSLATSEVPKHEIWFLTPERHAAELIFFNLAIGLLLFVTLKRGKDKSPVDDMIKPNEEQKLSLIMQVFRAILTVCYIVTVYHKVNGQKISNMLMPCHVATVCYLYCLYTKSKRNAHIMFNISMHYMFFTWLALALPDHRGLQQTGEIANFWIHHWILFIIPIHLIYTKHYIIDHTNNYYFKLAVCIGMFIHFDMMSISAIMSGLNVGYMLRPPPGTPLGKGEWFRWGHATAMIVMGVICGYLVPFLIEKLPRFGNEGKVTHSSGKKKSRSKNSDGSSSDSDNSAAPSNGRTHVMKNNTLVETTGQSGVKHKKT